MNDIEVVYVLSDLILLSFWSLIFLLVPFEMGFFKLFALIMNIKPALY